MKLKMLFIIILGFLPLDGFSEIVVSSTEQLSFGHSVGKDERDEAEHSRKRIIGISRFVLCVDGLKVFQTIGPAAGGIWGSSGYNLNQAVSTIQLYEEKDGRVVPATCSNNK